MRKILIMSFFLTLISCVEIFGPSEVSIYEPVQMTREELKNSISLTEAQDVVSSGKIYIKDDFIFVNDKYEGFHIYDNSNPSVPVKVKFLNIPGATDIAIRDNVLYVNQATDLVTLVLDTSNYTVEETGREIKVFTPLEISPDGVYFTPEEQKIIVKFKKQ